MGHCNRNASQSNPINFNNLPTCGVLVLLQNVGIGLALGNAKHLSTLVNVVGAAEKNVNLLKWDLLSLGDEEVDKDGEEDIRSHEEVKALETLVFEKGWKELLKNSIGDILHLRAHSDGLGADIHTWSIISTS